MKMDKWYVFPNRELIREELAKIGGTRAEQAEVLGVHQSTVYNIVNTKYKGRALLDTIKSVSDLTGRKVEELCDFKGRMLGATIFEKSTSKKPKKDKKGAAKTKEAPEKVEVLSPREELNEILNEEDSDQKLLEALLQRSKARSVRIQALSLDMDVIDRYRELVGQVSQEACTHTEAVRAIRAKVNKADKWDKLMRTTMSEIVEKVV